MVVVTIIAVVSALVLPTAVQGMRERRTQQAAVSVLDIVRETRSRAMYRGMAHTLRVRQVSSSLVIDSFEGTSSSCRLSRFGGGSFDPAAQIYALDLTTSTFTRDGIVGQISSPAGLAYLQICFTPLGVAYFSTAPIGDGTIPSAVWLNNSAAIGSGGNFLIDVYQFRGGADAGVRRRVVIPLAGVPRLRS